MRGRTAAQADLTRYSPIKKAQEWGTLALAWLSWLLAGAGGAALAGTFIGGIIANILGWFPAWVPALLLGAGIIAMLLDMFLDLTPNWLAIVCAIVLPSIARSVDGKLGADVTALSNDLRAQLDTWTVDYLGAMPSIGLALAAVVGSLLMARRVVVRGG